MSLYLGDNTPRPPEYREMPNDWGRGHHFRHHKVPPSAPFHYGNQPIASEMYDVTNLRRAANRPSDQLLPKPTEYPIGTFQPSYQLPAEHPYTSHIERTQMFPDPSSTLALDRSKSLPLVDENRERAAQVRGDDATAPYPVTDVDKARGGTGPWRREVVSSSLPSYSAPKQFADPYQFNVNVNRLNQAGYSPNGLYPTPPTYQNPNSILNRDLYRLGVSPRSADATVNQYKSDRLTHNAIQYTGNGPADSVTIDSSQEPVPQSNKEFIPPRPLQGRAATMGPASKTRPSHCRAPFGEYCSCWYCCEERADRQRHFDMQQMEAENRFKLINSQTPAHNITALRQKFVAAGAPKYGYSPQSSDQPQIFYNHMATYTGERSALYRPQTYSVDAAGRYGQLYQQLPLQFYVRSPSSAGVALSVEKTPYLSQGQFTQDGVRLQNDSEYGASYNTKTFLQENALTLSSQAKPENLMSTENNSIRRVASMSSIPYRSEPSNPTDRRGFNNPVISAYLGGRVGSASVQPAAWRPSCGVPWPHFNLAIYQNAFNRSAIHSDFHARFPEQPPDLRENVSAGRRHDFEGFNAQELRGSASARQPQLRLLY